MTGRVLMALLCMGLAGPAAGADYRFVGSTALGPDTDGPSHAVFETPDGRRLIVAAGQRIGGCRLAAVTPQTAVMECAEGWVTVALRSGLEGRSHGRHRGSAEYQVQLPRETVFVAPADRHANVRQMALEPEVRDGMLSGYRVAWVDPAGDFRRLGLREDDVIVSLNDVPAATPGPFMQAVNGLPGQSSFRLAVERSGALIDFTYLLD